MSISYMLISYMLISYMLISSKLRHSHEWRNKTHEYNKILLNINIYEYTISHIWMRKITHEYEWRHARTTWEDTYQTTLSHEHEWKDMTAYCICSVISSFSNLKRSSSSLGLFCHVPLKRDLCDWAWRLSSNVPQMPIALGVSFLHSYGITFIWDHIHMGSHSYGISFIWDLIQCIWGIIRFEWCPKCDMNVIPYEWDPIWMRSHMNEIPYECDPIWTWSHMNVIPYEWDPIWMWSHMNVIPYECDPIWIWSHMNVIPYEWRNDTPNAIGCTSYEFIRVKLRTNMNDNTHEWHNYTLPHTITQIKAGNYTQIKKNYT